MTHLIKKRDSIVALEEGYGAYHIAEDGTPLVKDDDNTTKILVTYSDIPLLKYCSISGTPNGVLVDFTLAKTVYPGSEVAIFNGSSKYHHSEVTLAETSLGNGIWRKITLSTAPLTGDVLEALIQTQE